MFRYTNLWGTFLIQYTATTFCYPFINRGIFVLSIKKKLLFIMPLQTLKLFFIYLDFFYCITKIPVYCIQQVLNTPSEKPLIPLGRPPNEQVEMATSVNLVVANQKSERLGLGKWVSKKGLLRKAQHIHWFECPL